MSDSNGDVVDSFMPFSTLEDETTDSEKQMQAVNADGENGNAYRVGENLKIDEAADVTEEATETEEIEETSSNGLIYVVVGIALAGIAILAGVLMKRKRG